MKKNLKNSKGITLIDIVTAIVLFSIFAGIIGEIYYSILLNNMKVRSNAIATYYAVEIAENIDLMPFEEVTDENLETDFQSVGRFIQGFSAEAHVTDCNQFDENILKKVAIEIKYEILNKEYSYTINKIKVKEI